MAISKLGQRRQVVIPKDFCEELGLQVGDYIELKRMKGTVVIKPKKIVDAEDTLSPDEEKLVEKGFKQLKRGEYLTWEQVKRDLEV